MFTPILVSMTMAIICDETVNYWWGAQRWGNAKVGLADSRRERDARPAGKQTKAEMTGIKNWDSISSTSLHQEGYISSGNSTLNFFRRLSGSSSRVGHSFWFYVDSFLSKSDHCLPLAVTSWWSYLGNVVKSSKAKFRSRFWMQRLVNILKLDFDQLVIWLKSSKFGENTQLLWPLFLLQCLHFMMQGEREKWRCSW